MIKFISKILAKKQKTINYILLSSNLIYRSNPLILMLRMKGGKRAEAGEWLSEIQALLYGIIKSNNALEVFMNNEMAGKKVFVENQEIKMDNNEKLWAAIYIIDNAILRIFATMDKIGQMVRVYYEHPDHGGYLQILPRKKCSLCLEQMDEKNCTFGTIKSYLDKYPRNKIIDNALVDLDKNYSINFLRPYRSGFVHRKNKLEKHIGIKGEVKSKYNDDGSVTTEYCIENKLPDLNELRARISEAYNAITIFINKTSNIIFPED